jgi:hypothetical protein
MRAGSAVSKAGCQPETLPIADACPNLAGGQKCVVPAVKMVKVASNISIPVGGNTLWHLGDEVYTGGSNEGLQRTTTDTPTLRPTDLSVDVPYLTFEISDWAAKVAAGFTKAKVTMDIKAMQTNGCPDNAVALSGDAGAPTLPGVNQSVSEWERKSFEFNVAEVGRTSANIIVTTGQCFIGGFVSDYDDFEINRLRVEFFN